MRLLNRTLGKALHPFGRVNSAVRYKQPPLSLSLFSSGLGIYQSFCYVGDLDLIVYSLYLQLSGLSFVSLQMSTLWAFMTVFPMVSFSPNQEVAVLEKHIYNSSHPPLPFFLSVGFEWTCFLGEKLSSAGMLVLLNAEWLWKWPFTTDGHLFQPRANTLRIQCVK